MAAFSLPGGTFLPRGPEPSCGQLVACVRGWPHAADGNSRAGCCFPVQSFGPLVPAEPSKRGCREQPRQQR